jgi:aryl-alcohol dehydrogenase-like predicted oxidoreductase
VPIEETLAALGELVKAGKIRHIGVSNESPWGVCEYIKQAEMKGLPRIATIQNLYNLTARAFETTLLDEVCYREEVSLLAYSPLAFGQLSAKYLDNPQAHGRLTIYPPTWSPRYVRPEVLAAAAGVCGAGACARDDAGADGAGLVLFALVRGRDHYRGDDCGAAEGEHRCGEYGCRLR